MTMKSKKLLLATAAACAAWLGTLAVAQQFNFAYRVTDSRINVFDDGKNTRIQLPEGTLVPAVFSLKTQGQKLLDLKRDGNYLVADGVHQSLRLVWANGREATATFTGTADTERLGMAVVFGSSEPSNSFGSVPAPVKAASTSEEEKATERAKVQSLHSSKGVVLPLEKFLQPSDRVGAATEAKAAPAPATPTMVPPTAVSDLSASPQAPDPRQAASATKPKAYAISVSDETLSKALRRWCTQSGCQLIWTAEKDFPVIAAQYGTDFEDAIDRLMRDTKRSEYPLRACLYENNVLRVIHASKSCGS